MLVYIAKRLSASMALIAGILVVVFIALRLAAGDPAEIFAGVIAEQQVLERYRQQFGTDKPLPQQLLTFVSGIPRGNFGESFRYQTPVMELVASTVPKTLLLGGISLVIVTALAIFMGVLSAVKPRSAFDRMVLALNVFGQSAPVFWLGLMFVLIFSVNLQLLPATGLKSAQNLILPVATIVIWQLPWQLRVLRSGMIEVLLQDYIRTARAYGIRASRIYFAYALRNAAIPLLTVFGIQAANLLAGTVVVEVVFNYPGMGKLFLDAVNSRDYPLVQAITMITASLFVLFNFFVDIAYTFVDPRLRLGAASTR